ncbi:MAG: radical SAM protein [Candidatus Cloacimonetes bacterium]|nr:radical SAM protein [Candidatus Cloacimonadota bacterium]
MNILDSFPKLNSEKITAVYNYRDFSFVIENNKIRTTNKILSNLIWILYKNSNKKLSIKNLLDLIYEDKTWNRNRIELEHFFRKLYNDKFFVDIGYPCNNHIKIYDNSKELWPIHISFETTNKCNFKCFFCYNDFSQQEKEMNLSEIENVFTKLRKHGLLSVELTGGELFTRSDAFEIIDIVYSNVSNFFILTNGYFLNKEVVERLKMYRKKLSAIGISFHSADKNIFEKITRKKGSYEKIIHAIKLLKKENDFIVRIACPVINQSYDELEEMCKLLRNLKVDLVQFGINMLPEFIISKEFIKKKIVLNNHIEKLHRIYPELNMEAYEFGEETKSIVNIIACGAFSKNLVITPSGNAKPCAYFPENSIFNIGKLNNYNLSSRKIHLLKKFIVGNHLINNVEINKICESCDSYEICGHCFYVRSLLNNDKNRCLLTKRYGFQFEQELKRVK